MWQFVRVSTSSGALQTICVIFAKGVHGTLEAATRWSRDWSQCGRQCARMCCGRAVCFVLTRLTLVMVCNNSWERWKRSAPRIRTSAQLGTPWTHFTGYNCEAPLRRAQREHSTTYTASSLCAAQKLSLGHSQAGLTYQVLSYGRSSLRNPIVREQRTVSLAG